MDITEENKIKRIQLNETHQIFQTIFGCKWSLTIYSLIEKGVNRPGQIEKSVEGLSTKVMNHCLKKSVEFNILKKVTFNELPPRTEYSFTNFGQKFLLILDEIKKLSEK
jgi:DNA-binding HxlR family transcriptional regulator